MLQVPTELRFSVIIPVLNDATGLKRCLASLRAEARVGMAPEIVVVDNGSTDGSLAAAHEAGAVTIVAPDLSVSALRNRGAECSSGATLAFVDADHEVLAGWFEAAAEVLAADNVGAAGAPCLAPSTGTWVQRMYGRLRHHVAGRADVEWLGSGNLVVRRAAFDRIGGFDETLSACEDVDLCHRLRLAGWRLVSDDRLRNVHYGDPRTLRELFGGELWRGRDNLRVSVRYPTLRGLPSVAIPLIDLAAMGASLIGLALWRLGGLWLVASMIGVFVGLSVLRALRMIAGDGPRGLVSIMQALLVAGTYDAARALAFVVRAKHRRAVEAGPSASTESF